MVTGLQNVRTHIRVGFQQIPLGLLLHIARKQEARLAVIDAQDKAAVDAYNNSVAYIYDTLWTVFGNRSYQYMKKIDKNNGQQIAAQQSAEKFINQFNLAMKAIDSFRLNYAAAMSDEVSSDYSLLKSQLVQFTATLSHPVNVDHLIDALDGTRIWLRRWYSTERLKKHFRFI